MSLRYETSALLADGRCLFYTQQEHESTAEFQGRLLCLIEDAILDGANRPVPAGTKWVEWTSHGSPLYRFHAGGLGFLKESTGAQFEDRVRHLPGLLNLDEAKKALAEPVPVPTDRRDYIFRTVDDVVSGFLFYDRKEDLELPQGGIEEAIEEGELTLDELCEKFTSALRKGME